MASAYSSFATNGLYAEPYLIDRILDEDGQVLYQHQVEQQQVIAAPIAEAARIPLLEVPTAEGTAERAAIGRPQGGKTGTHQDYRDAWYVGFVPQYTTAVWVGYERDQVPLRNVRIHGEYYERVFGGSVPAPIWAEFMRMVLTDVEALDFPRLTEEELQPFLKPPTTIVPYLIGKTEAEAVSLATEAKLIPNVNPDSLAAGRGHRRFPVARFGSRSRSRASDSYICLERPGPWRRVAECDRPTDQRGLPNDQPIHLLNWDLGRRVRDLRAGHRPRPGRCRSRSDPRAGNGDDVQEPGVHHRRPGRRPCATLGLNPFHPQT